MPVQCHWRSLQKSPVVMTSPRRRLTGSGYEQPIVSQMARWSSSTGVVRTPPSSSSTVYAGRDRGADLVGVNDGQQAVGNGGVAQDKAITVPRLPQGAHG